MMRGLVVCCSFLVAAVGLPSQSVHVVGPGGFVDIDAALAVAAPGDIVNVEPGQYPSFTVTIPVTIRALPYVSGPQPKISSDPPVTIDLQNEEAVHLVNFRLTHAQVVGGRAVFDSCSFAGFSSSQFLGQGPTEQLLVQGATAHLIGCTLFTNSLFVYSDAIAAENSDVTVVSSSLSGTFGLAPGSAVRLVDSRLFSSDTWFSGGNYAGSLAQPAVDAQGNSQVWLSDCNLSASYGACPVEVQSSAQVVHLDRCQLETIDPSCPSFASVTPLLGVSQVAAMSPGQLFELDFTTEPNGFVFVLAGFALATYDIAPLLEQPSWIEFSQAFVDAGLLTGPTGQATYGFTVPNDPSLVDVSVWFEGIGGASGGLQVSPVVGGVVR